MFNYVGECLKGRGTLAEALIGIQFLGGTIVAAVLGLVKVALGGDHASTLSIFTLECIYGFFLVFAGFCVWRCAFNVRYRLVAVGVRVFVVIFVGLGSFYLWNSFRELW